ncbi:MAG: helix-turn-helix domain-containing protein [Anaerovoracaceae bacterium]
MGSNLNRFRGHSGIEYVTAEPAFRNSMDVTKMDLTDLTREKIRLNIQIDELKFQLKTAENGLAVVLKAGYKCTNALVKEMIEGTKGSEATKKDIILQYYKRGISLKDIISAVECKPEYVYKVIMEYRHKNGIPVNNKGEKTRTSVLQKLQEGCTPQQTAQHCNVSVQYVYQIKKNNKL